MLVLNTLDEFHFPVQANSNASTTNGGTNYYKNISAAAHSSEVDSSSRQDRSNPHASPTSPTRNTIRTSPYVHIPNHIFTATNNTSPPSSNSSTLGPCGGNFSSGGANASTSQNPDKEINYANVFNFMDDCNYQGKRIISVTFRALNSHSTYIYIYIYIYIYSNNQIYFL